MKPQKHNTAKPLLLFDFGTILTGLSKERCITALEKIGCGKIAYYVDECRQEDLFHELEIGGSIEAFCQEARRQSSHIDEKGVFCECKATDEDICWAWNELLTGVPVEKLRMVRRLREQGYNTAILSNTNMIHWEKSVRDFFTIDGLTVDDYFDDIYLSCHLAMVKPDQCIYNEVKRRVAERFSPEQAEHILFIDDSKKNCDAAERVGIDTIYDPHGDRWMTILGREVPKAALIGNFDGVHLGHQYMLSRLKEEADKRAMGTMVVTFDRHPKELFIPNFHGTYLTTAEEKRELLLSYNIDNVLLLPFDKPLADTKAYDFMQHLHDDMGVRLLLLGYDNRFGKRDSTEDFSSYVAYGREIGVEVIQCEPHCTGADVPSSSLVRKKVIGGEVDKAATLMGRPYTISGTVVKGFQEGRKIGFPTANILTAPNKLLPANGVYATRTIIPDTDGRTIAMPSVTNIGTRPTYQGTALSVETHIPHFSGDLYGKTVSVEFIHRIRDERTFATINELKAQIQDDIRHTLSDTPSEKT